MIVPLTRIRHGAFTLVEVLVVVVIIGIAGAVVVPALIRPSNLGVQAAARLVISDILIAQNEAIASGATRQVVFEPAFNRYRLTDGDGNTLSMGWKPGGSGAANYVVDFGTDRRFPGVTLQNVNIGVSQTVVFDALGAPAVGGFLELAGASVTYRVSIAPFTGRVTIDTVP